QANARLTGASLEIHRPDAKVAEVEGRPCGAGVEPEVERASPGQADDPVGSAVEPRHPERRVLGQLHAPRSQVLADDAASERTVDEVAGRGATGRQLAGPELDPDRGFADATQRHGQALDR